MREVVASSRRGRLRAGDTGGDTRATRGNTTRAMRGNTTRTTRGNTTRATRGDVTHGKGTSRWDTCEKKGEQSANEKEKEKEKDKKRTRYSVTPCIRERKGTAL